MLKYGFGELKFTNGGSLGAQEENRQSIFVATRNASRAWTGRIMTLSSTIIAFSVSVASLSAFQSNLNIDKLNLSWNFFLAALILGAFNLLFESRVAYTATWIEKNIEFRSVDTPKIKKDYLKAFLLLIVVFIYPPVSISNKTIDLKVASILVHNFLYKIFGLVFLFELLTFMLFVTGLFTFLRAFTI